MGGGWEDEGCGEGGVGGVRTGMSWCVEPRLQTWEMRKKVDGRT